MAKSFKVKLIHKIETQFDIIVIADNRMDAVNTALGRPNYAQSVASLSDPTSFKFEQIIDSIEPHET